MKCLGKVASPGMAVGPVYLLSAAEAAARQTHIDVDDIAAEQSRLKGAVERSKQALGRSASTMVQTHGAAYQELLEVYLMMHDDPLLVGRALELIAERAINAEWAVAMTVSELAAELIKNDAVYFRERAADVHHVGEHIVRALSGAIDDFVPPPPGSIVVGTDVSAVDAARLLCAKIAGLAIARGGTGGHTAILARALGVPALVEVDALMASAKSAEYARIDAIEGAISFGDRAALSATPVQSIVAPARVATDEGASAVRTADGARVDVRLNIDIVTDADELQGHSVGLCRTEFLFFDCDTMPDEQLQIRRYIDLARRTSPGELVLRTFDLRHDKVAFGPVLPAGSLRRAVAAVEPLRTQLRAIVSAAANTSTAVLLPMVSEQDELIAAKSLLAQSVQELKSQGLDCRMPPVGAMVELPLAVARIESLAAHADFLSLGTGDLAQYTLGKGQRDACVDVFDPRVLRLIANAIECAQRQGFPLSMCGDMAADPFGLALALGFGYRQVSVPVSALGTVKAVIAQTEIAEAKRLCERALQCKSAAEVVALGEALSVD